VVRGRRPTLGLSLIARDEERFLPGLLESIDGAFDQVALLDTGSSDRTVEIFTDWASRQSLPLGYAVANFDWIDDFGAARNAAAALLETDWEAWADCDDVIRGATRLRRDVRLVAQSGGDWLHARYQWAPASPPFTTRPYACRRGAGTWVGPIHERKVLAGGALPPPCAAIAGEPVVWQQRRDHLGPVNGLRDLSILCKWLNGCADESGPSDRLVTQLIGERLAMLGDEIVLGGAPDVIFHARRSLLLRKGQLSPRDGASVDGSTKRHGEIGRPGGEGKPTALSAPEAMCFGAAAGRGPGAPPRPRFQSVPRARRETRTNVHVLRVRR
jgi:hypothetical protein